MLIVVPQTVFAWRVDQLRGAVEAENQNKTVPLANNQEIKDGSIITTGAGARVRLVNEDSQITIGPETRLQLPAVGNSQDNFLSIWFGRLRAQVGSKTAAKVKFKTLTTVAATREAEFFIATDGENDTLCAIEGSVEVTFTKTGRSLLVAEGRVLRTSNGERPVLSQNQDKNIRAWVSETSFDELKFVGNPYEIRPSLMRVDRLAYAGLNMQISSRTKAKPSSNLVITQTRIEPAVSYGREFFLFASPVIYRHNSTEKTTTDSSPRFEADQKAGLAWGRLYLELQKPEYQIQAGAIRVKWNDGAQVTDSSWRLDQNSLTGLRAKVLMGEWALEGLVTHGIQSEQANSGLSHISYRGLKADVPGDWGNLFIVSRFHDLYDFGFFSEKRFADFEYKTTSSYQTDDTNREFSADLALRYYLLKGLRVESRYLSVTKNYEPGEESLYNLGLSNLFVRKDLVQVRQKLDWQINRAHYAGIEYLTSNGRTEWDLLYYWRVASDLTWLIGGYHVLPNISGFVTRLNFAY